MELLAKIYDFGHYQKLPEGSAESSSIKVNWKYILHIFINKEIRYMKHKFHSGPKILIYQKNSRQRRWRRRRESKKVSEVNLLEIFFWENPFSRKIDEEGGLSGDEIDQLILRMAYRAYKSFPF